MALSRRIRRHVVDLLHSSTTIPFGESIFAAAASAPAAALIEVPFEYTSREYACMLLHIAAGIEHALMVQYLYAGYSLGGAQVPADKAALVRQWQEAVLGIAKEEMGHLMTVQNLLRCVGGSLTLDRGDFPWDSDFYPFDFRLEPLTRKSLAKYVITESPDDGSFSGAEAELIRKLAEEDSDGKPVNRVGALYDRLIAIFQHPQMIPDSAFRDETFLYQANWDEWGRGHRVEWWVGMSLEIELLKPIPPLRTRRADFPQRAPQVALTRLLLSDRRVSSDLRIRESEPGLTPEIGPPEPAPLSASSQSPQPLSLHF